MTLPTKHNLPRKKRSEDSGPAFPGARFPLSDVPATNSSTSRAYSLTHDKSGKQIDNLNAPADQTTRRYIPTGKRGNGGVWTNNNGTRLGQSNTEDSDFMPSKSTGDIPSSNLMPAIHVHLHTQGAPLNTQKAAKLANKRRKGM